MSPPGYWWWPWEIPSCSFRSWSSGLKLSCNNLTLKEGSLPCPSLLPSFDRKIWNDYRNVFTENIIKTSGYLTYPLVYLYSEQSSSCPEVTPLVVTPLVFIGLPESLSSYTDKVRLNLLLKDSEFRDGAGSAATATEDDLNFFKIYFRPEI